MPGVSMYVLGYEVPKGCLKGLHNIYLGGYLSISKAYIDNYIRPIYRVT